MNRLTPIFFFLFVLTLYAKAQNTDPIVMTISGDPVYKSDMERAYLKNSSIETKKKESFKDFVKSYTDLQLVLKEAREQKIDTIGRYKEECELLKSQLFEKYGYNDSLHSDSLIKDEKPEVMDIMKDYSEGLLLYETKELNVWQKAKNDEEGLSTYFEKNKKKYKWKEPRFKGIVLLYKNQDDTLAINRLLSSNAIDENIVDTIKSYFDQNGDQVLVDYDIWMKGSNKYVDNVIFGEDIPQVRKLYPYYKVKGQMLKKPENYRDILSLVQHDYQKQVEDDWIKDLRKKYYVNVNKAVLKTIK